MVILVLSGVTWGPIPKSGQGQMHSRLMRLVGNQLMLHTTLHFLSAETLRTGRAQIFCHHSVLGADKHESSLYSCK